MIYPTTGAITVFDAPTTNEPQGVTAGPDGNLWFSDPPNPNLPNVGELDSVNPSTDVITEYPIPYAGSTPDGIAAGPDGNLSFLDPGANEIGVATLSTSSLVVTTQPPASVAAGSPFGLTVTAENSAGNAIATFNGTVTVALASGGGASGAR